MRPLARNWYYCAQFRAKRVHCLQLGGDVEQPWVLSNYYIIHKTDRTIHKTIKPEVHNISLRRRRRPRAGIPSRHVISQQGQLSLASPGVTKSSTSFGWGKSETAISAGWQVTLCDPIRDVSSRSGEACCVANFHSHSLDSREVDKTQLCNGPRIKCALELGTSHVGQLALLFTPGRRRIQVARR